MIDEITLLKKRVKELSERMYTEHRFIYTGFLNLAEIDAFLEETKKMEPNDWTLYGGNPDCERKMGRFGCVQDLGYQEEYPIHCIKIHPTFSKERKTLSHRDYLGALMNLGIKRNTLGDILIQDADAYLFCHETVAPFITEQLRRIAHVDVACEIFAAGAALEFYQNRLPVEFSASSERIDGVIGKAFQFSRSQGADLIQRKMVFLNARLCVNGSALLKKKDVISVRGYGKFEYQGVLYQTKKEKLRLKILKYN